MTSDSAKWSDNNHYYGIGIKYQANAIKSSLIFEAADNKGTATDATTYGDVISQNQYAAANGWTAPLTTAQKEEYKNWAKTKLVPVKLPRSPSMLSITV